jgi:DNA-binding transcriptional regulator YiaG
MQALLEEVEAIRQLPSPALARAMREEARISRRRLAKELGTHEVTIWRWEAGVSRPRGQMLVDYARILAALKHQLGGA